MAGEPMESLDKNKLKTLSTQPKVRPKSKTYICNFRAPNKQLYHEWQDYVKLVTQTQHADVCYVTLELIRAYKKAIEQAQNQTQLNLPFQTVNITQQNNFQYIVTKPRRKTPMQGIPTCEAHKCQQIATYQALHKTLNKTYRLCPKHLTQFRQFLINITQLPDSKTFVYGGE
jgi:hypothetical protein